MNTQEQIAKDTTYNGWTNYETWCVNLWLSNDQGTDNAVHEMAVDCLNNKANDEPAYSLAGAISNFVDELQESFVTNDASMFSDLLSHAIQRVNWREIAQAYIDGVDPDEVEPDEETEEEIGDDENQWDWKLGGFVTIHTLDFGFLEVVRSVWLDVADLDYDWRNDTNTYSRE